MARKKDKNKVPDLTIFDEQRKSKQSAKKTLEIAKAQETEKLNQGFVYKLKKKKKTRVLTKK